MSAKLIFFKSPKTGEENFQFCPITQVGCSDCFLPKKCRGESDKNVAFNLRLVKGHYQMMAIKSNRKGDK